jgi:hypothetical protein
MPDTIIRLPLPLAITAAATTAVASLTTLAAPALYMYVRILMQLLALCSCWPSCGFCTHHSISTELCRCRCLEGASS